MGPWVYRVETPFQKLSLGIEGSQMGTELRYTM